MTRQLERAAELLRSQGPSAACWFLEQLSVVDGVRGDPALQARVLTELARRLLSTRPFDPGAGRRCLLQMETLVRQQDGRVDGDWLRLRGSISRLRSALGEETSSPSLLAGDDPIAVGMRATRLLTRSLRRSEDAAAWAEAGAAYLESGQGGLARRCLERAIARRVRDGGRSYFLLGQSWFHEENHEEAARCFEEAVSAGWPKADTVRWQAFALFELERHAECEELARQAMANGGADEHLSLVLGKVRLITDDLDEAERWFVEADRNDECRGEARYGRGLCALARNELETAKGWFLPLLSEPACAPQAALGLGMIAAARGEIADAVEHLQRALEALPAHGPLHAQLGACLLALGDGTAAFVHADRALELIGDDPELLGLSALAALSAGDPGLAFERLVAYQRAGGSVLSVAALQRRACAEAAAAAIARGDLATALDPAEEYWERSGGPESLRKWLGLVNYGAARQRLARGESGEACAEMLLRAWELHPGEETAAGRLVAQVFGKDPEAIAEVLDAESTTALASPGFLRFVGLVAAYQRGDAETFARAAAEASGEAERDPAAVAMERFARLHLAFEGLGRRSKAAPEDIQELLEIVAWEPFRTAFFDQREALNRLLVGLLAAGFGQGGVDRIVQSVRDLAAHEPGGFWDEAVALAAFLKASRSGEISAIGSALEVCHEREHSDKPLLSDLTLRIERAYVAKLLEADRVADAMGLLDKTMGEDMDDEATSRLRRALRELLSTESLEGAYLAAKAGDLERARRIWAHLSARGDHRAAHSLAASLFQEAYDAVAAGERDAADTLARALPYWRQIVDDERFWDALAVKAEALRSNQYPFERERLAELRGRVSRDALGVVARLGVKYVRADQLELAKKCVEAIVSATFDGTLAREVLESDFGEALAADSLLMGQAADRLDRAWRAAREVLTCDPENRRALHLSLSAASSQIDMVQRRELPGMAALALFAGVRERLGSFPAAVIHADPRLRAARGTYWREYANVLNATANEAVGDHNSAEQRAPGTGRRLLTIVRKCVDTALIHVIPECERLGIENPHGEQFRKWDSQLDGVHPPLPRGSAGLA